MNAIAHPSGRIMQTSRKEWWPILSEESCRLADRNALAYPLERILQTRKTDALAHPVGRIMQIIRRYEWSSPPFGLIIKPTFWEESCRLADTNDLTILSEESCRLADTNALARPFGRTCRLADRNALAHLFEESCRLADTNDVAQILRRIMQTSRQEWGNRTD
jgi:hypothetical protein